MDRLKSQSKSKRTIPVSNGVLAHRKRIGASIWAFLWLLDHTTSEMLGDDGRQEGLVYGGQPVPLSEIADDLDMSWDAIYEHLNHLAKAGYIRKISHGTGRPNGYAVNNSKKFPDRRTRDDRSTPETAVQKTIGSSVQIARGTPVQNATNLPLFVREPTDKSPSVDKEVILKEIKRDKDADPGDASAAAQLLSQECGEYSKRFVSDRAKQIMSEAKKRGVICKAVAEFMIAQWRLYNSSRGKLNYPVQSAERFWTSGTWHDKSLWPWKPEVSHPSQPSETSFNDPETQLAALGLPTRRAM